MHGAKVRWNAIIRGAESRNKVERIARYLWHARKWQTSNIGITMDCSTPAVSTRISELNAALRSTPGCRWHVVCTRDKRGFWYQLRMV